MHITEHTSEQPGTTGEALARVADWFRALREQLTALARRLSQALRPLAEQLRTLGERLRTDPARRHRDRPAWCSPYGPAPRRRR
jgi:hypothetical protein